VVGASGIYEARCRRCFEPNPASAKKDSVAPLMMRTRAGAAGTK
jgi:hypothetical protein